MLLESKLLWYIEFLHLLKLLRDVNKQVEKVKIKYEQFKDLLKRVDTSTNVEFKELRKGNAFEFNFYRYNYCY